MCSLQGEYKLYIASKLYIYYKLYIAYKEIIKINRFFIYIGLWEFEFGFLSIWKEYERTDKFLFDYGLNGISLGS